MHYTNVKLICNSPQIHVNFLKFTPVLCTFLVVPQLSRGVLRIGCPTRMSYKFYFLFVVIDAGGKIGSSILQGNINQLGNFDLCTAISTKIKLSEESSVRVKGKYCLAHLDIQATEESLKYLIHLIHGKSLLRSTINDPSHFVPRFTTFSWGVCVPAACTVDDVQEFLEDSLENYNTTGIRLNVDVDEGNCHTVQKFNLEKLVKSNHPMVAVVACFTFVLVIVVLSTLNECWTHWRGAKIFIEILDGQNGSGDEAKNPDEEMVSLVASETETGEILQKF